MKVEKKKFRWRIDGFSSLLDKCADHVQSSVFEIKGLHWYDSILLFQLLSRNLKMLVKFLNSVSRHTIICM
jgi:hypothetical protein